VEELIQTTEIPKVSYLQGFWDSWAPSDIGVADTEKLISTCRKLNYDYVLFDLGAGPLQSYLELFNQADEKILIADSEPTSVEKTYRFLESFICYSLRESSTTESYQKLQGTLRAYKSSSHKGYFSFRSYLRDSVGFSFDYFEQLNQKPVRLLVNSCRCRQDQDLGHSIKSVCHKYYDLHLDYVGAIDFDNAVWQSVKSREPMLIEKPFTPLAGQFLSVCKQLTNANSSANLYRAAV
jgi:flagellar biosynthesis protein FlhG